LWLTANGRLHWADKSRRTRALREAARLVTLSAIRKREAVGLRLADVTATVHYPQTRRQDPANAAPTVKALIDGCVDAGLLPDDDAQHLPVVAFRRGEPTHQPGFYRIVLTFEGEPS
jgi:crossover junction endodeoxyribonuclease RusA